MSRTSGTAAPSPPRTRFGIIGGMAKTADRSQTETIQTPDADVPAITPADIRVLIVDNDDAARRGRGRKPGARRLRLHRRHQRPARARS